MIQPAARPARGRSTLWRCTNKIALQIEELAMSAENEKYQCILRDMHGEERGFSSFKSLVTFVESQNVFWNEGIGNLSGQKPFNQIITSVRAFSQEIANSMSSDGSTNEQQLESIVGRLQQHSVKFPFSQTPFAIAFVAATKVGAQQGHAFWLVSTNHTNGPLPNITIPFLEGVILGYEFFHQDESVIYRRRESEKRAFVALRKTLSDQTDEIVTHIGDFRREINDWKTASHQDLATDRESYKNEQTDFLTTSAEKLETQIARDKEDREAFFATAKKQIEDLEALYREKLRLEPAATYWGNRAIALKSAGRSWGALLALATTSIGLGFAWLFHEWMMSGKVIEKFSAMHWQGIVLLVATVTMFIFLIRVLGRMTFSSFHLQRDAEERELLSYLYLALSEKGKVDDESRRVVLQSLFSRAETGLLSGDHGPTIPVAEVVQKLKSN